MATSSPVRQMRISHYIENPVMVLKDKLQRAMPVVATGINADAGTLDCFMYEGEVIVTGQMGGLKQY